MAKRQRIKDGLILKIPTGDGKLSFGKVLSQTNICVYDYRIDEKHFDEFLLKDLIKSPILFYVALYEYVIKDGVFEVIANTEVRYEEVLKIPPAFLQDGYTLECTLYYYEPPREIKVRKEECIGLEPICVYDHTSVIDRIVAHYNKKKVWFIEENKVILSKDDPRYCNANIRWDFEKEEWVNDN
ncbi:MAG: immunity 26/phosphotriesterase HocA family protein [Chitinophagales bacterium]|nr:immunity 26/phosphotriesterase HocA family protein [Chitinophagales bacterium]